MKGTRGSDRQKSSDLSHLPQRLSGITRDKEGEGRRREKDTGTRMESRMKKKHGLQNEWMVEQQSLGRRSKTRCLRVDDFYGDIGSFVHGSFYVVTSTVG